MWRISIHSDFDSLGGPLSPCGSHWLRLEPFTQIRSRTLCALSKYLQKIFNNNVKNVEHYKKCYAQVLLIWYIKGNT